jgi:hypothetical protein
MKNQNKQLNDVLIIKLYAFFSIFYRNINKKLSYFNFDKSMNPFAIIYLLGSFFLKHIIIIIHNKFQLEK